MEKERLEKVAKRDKIRKWPENQVYLVQKPEGMQNLPVFMTQPGAATSTSFGPFLATFLAHSSAPLHPAHAMPCAMLCFVPVLIGC